MESSGKESTTDISVLFVSGSTLYGGLWGPYLCHGNDFMIGHQHITLWYSPACVLVVTKWFMIQPLVVLTELFPTSVCFYAISIKYLFNLNL